MCIKDRANALGEQVHPSKPHPILPISPISPIHPSNPSDPSHRASCIPHPPDDRKPAPVPFLSKKTGASVSWFFSLFSAPSVMSAQASPLYQPCAAGLGEGHRQRLACRRQAAPAVQERQCAASKKRRRCRRAEISAAGVPARCTLPVRVARHCYRDASPCIMAFHGPFKRRSLRGHARHDAAIMVARALHPCSPPMGQHIRQAPTPSVCWHQASLLNRRHYTQPLAQVNLLSPPIYKKIFATMECGASAPLSPPHPANAYWARSSAAAAARRVRVVTHPIVDPSSNLGCATAPLSHSHQVSSAIAYSRQHNSLSNIYFITGNNGVLLLIPYPFTSLLPWNVSLRDGLQLGNTLVNGFCVGVVAKRMQYGAIRFGIWQQVLRRI